MNLEQFEYVTKESGCVSNIFGSKFYVGIVTTSKPAIIYNFSITKF